MVLKEHSLARWLSWLERRPVTAEVVGSNPIRVASLEIRILNFISGILAQLGEHLPYKQRVIGSSPIGPTRWETIIDIFICLPVWRNRQTQGT